MIAALGEFKRLVTQWTRRARQHGQAGVGRIDEDHMQQAARIQQQLDDILPPRFYHHVLDFGAGWGRFTRALEARGSHVWAADIVPAWVDVARQRGKTCTAVQLDSPVLPLDSNSMDLIVDIMTLQSITDERMMLQCAAELRRVAAPGGTVISLHKADDRPPAVLAARLGLADSWSALMTSEIDEADDMYYFLVGRGADS